MGINLVRRRIGEKSGHINPFPFLNGILAGGAVRDYVLGIKPNDYDYFYGSDEYQKIHNDLIQLKNRGGVIVKTSKKYTGRDGQVWASPTTVNIRGKKVQLISFTRSSSGRLDMLNRIRMILSNFDYTINMLAEYEEVIYQFVLSDIKTANHNSVNWKVEPLYTSEWRSIYDLAPQAALQTRTLSIPRYIKEYKEKRRVGSLTAMNNLDRILRLRRHIDGKIDRTTLIDIISDIRRDTNGIRLWEHTFNPLNKSLDIPF